MNAPDDKEELKHDLSKHQFQGEICACFAKCSGDEGHTYIRCLTDDHVTRFVTKGHAGPHYVQRMNKARYLHRQGKVQQILKSYPTVNGRKRRFSGKVIGDTGLYCVEIEYKESKNGFMSTRDIKKSKCNCLLSCDDKKKRCPHIGSVLFSLIDKNMKLQKFLKTVQSGAEHQV